MILGGIISNDLSGVSSICMTYANIARLFLQPELGDDTRISSFTTRAANFIQGLVGLQPHAL